MRFLYKIYSQFDGFTPATIPDRMTGRRLWLGWTRYIDVVDDGDEVWVFFVGPHPLTPGVYIKGHVLSHDHTRRQVLLRVAKWSVDRPLTDSATSSRLKEAVAGRGRQVFLYPTERATPPDCNVDSTATTCRAHLCAQCPVWKDFPIVQKSSLRRPSRLDATLLPSFAPAFWVIPSRCYLNGSRRPSPEIEHTTQLFMRFKLGQANLAYPLALGMYRSLQQRGLLEWDALVPIPLSPDKARDGEIHRSRLLARELGDLLGTRVSQPVDLLYPISKRRLLKKGVGPASFEAKYLKALVLGRRLSGVDRILLVDDVCTHGSTLTCVAQKLREQYPAAQIGAATGGQMILREAVKDERDLLA